MSKIAKILETIKDSHVMGPDGLRDYHAAKAARDANRCGTTPERFKQIRRALKNHRVIVSDSGMGTIRIFNPETKAEYLSHP